MTEGECGAHSSRQHLEMASSKIILWAFTCVVLSPGCFSKNLEAFLQPDDVDSGAYDDFQSTSPSLCTRTCKGDTKICYYKFYLENYSAMGPACRDCPQNVTACFNPQCIMADGFEKGVTVVNRRIPGPSVQVCKGDVVVADIINALPAATTTIHWHGCHQKGSNYMDGVPMVTQCPILPAQTFRYHFQATESGTHFWHSHSGLQKLDGIFGSLIVREPQSEDKSGDLYDHDLPSHVITINDWMHMGAEQKLPGFRHPPNDGQIADSILINGRGIYAKASMDLLRELETNDHIPLTEFVVKPNKRYRFRVIGSTCTVCPVMLSVQGHKMKMISSDGLSPFNPVVVDNLGITSGERYDFILETNQKVGKYWIVVRGMMDCRDVMQVAVLKYEGATGEPQKGAFMKPNQGLTLNHPNSFCDGSDPSNICFHHLQNAHPVPIHIAQGVGDVRIHLSFGAHDYLSPDNLFQPGKYNKYFQPLGGRLMKSLTSNISNILPPVPVTSQLGDVPSSIYCHNSCPNPTMENPCDCLNVYKMPTGSVVDVLVTDTVPYTPDGFTHPFHLHGHSFYVLEEGIFQTSLYEGVKEVTRRLDAGEIKNRSPPMKDNLAVPAGGYVLVRFVADNPGFWFMHCHIAVHLDMGMSAVFQVGEPTELPPVPEGFPTCNSYLPDI